MVGSPSTGGSFSSQRELLGGGHLDEPRFRRWEKNVEILDLACRIPTTGTRRDEIRVLFVVRRTKMVRPCRETLHPGAQIVGIQPSVKLCLERTLRRTVGGRETLSPGRYLWQILRQYERESEEGPGKRGQTGGGYFS